jgi:hypothetical protein
MLPWLFVHAVMAVASVDAADSPVMLVGALIASCTSIIWTMLMFLTKLLVQSARSEFR